MAIVNVEKGDIDRALKQLKRMMDNSRVLKILRAKQAYQKPSEKRKLGKKAAIKRRKKRENKEKWTLL